MSLLSFPLAPRLPAFTRRRSTLMLVGAVIVVGLGLSLASMASAEPEALRVVRGTIGHGQSVDALASKDLEGRADDWDSYIEFMPGDDARHVSVMRIAPEGSGTETVTVDVNFRGPESDENLWTLSIRDVEAKKWIRVFSNEGAQSWVWTAGSTTLDDPSRFINSRGSVRLRYRSSTDFDVSQLDQVTLTLGGGPTAPTTATTVTPTTVTPTTGTPTTQVSTTAAPTPTTAAPTTSPPPTSPSTTDPSTTAEPSTTARPTTTAQPTTTTTAPAPTTTAPATTTRPPTTVAPTTAPPPTNPPGNGGVDLPPAGAGFDYQIGGAYPVPSGVGIVSRDWTASAAGGVYNVCYINAFQTQGNYGGNRPDESQNWPSSVVLASSEDPNWPGEFLIDISTAAKRTTAANHLQQIINTCADKGFDAVEYDNLDSWTRLNNLPFDRTDTVTYATLLVDRAHAAGLAVAQKNTTDLIDSGDHRRIGFDFAIAEQCGQYNECGVFVSGYGDHVIAIEYSDSGFSRACSQYGDRISVVRRNVSVSPPGSGGYVRETC